MSDMTEHEELRVSNDAMNDAVELQRRIAEEGYLFFRRLQDPDKLRALRREMIRVAREAREDISIMAAEVAMMHEG